MPWNRAFRLHSFAQYFCTITLALASSAQALTQSECDNLKPSEMTAKQQRECSKVASSDADCENAKRNASDALKDLNKSCGDSGLGRNCISKIKKCAEVGGSDDFENDEDLLVAFSEALGVPQNKVGSSCPKYSGQGFFERKEKYTKDLESINDSIESTKKEIADLGKEFTEDVQKVQEEIADAQKDLKEKQLDIKKEQRERAAEQAKTSAELAKNLRSQESLILQKRQEIANILRSKNSSMIAMAESATKRACWKKVKEMKKDYESIASGSSGSFITRASQKKKALQDEYDNCMAQFDQQRIALIEQTDQKVEQAEDSINNAQSDIDNMNQQLSSMSAQETEAKNDENTALANESSALSEKITRATAKLQSLQQTTQQKDSALKEKLNKLDQRSKEASNAMARLGATPDDETSNVKMSQVEAAYDDYQAAVSQIPTMKSDGGLCDFRDPLAAKGASGGNPGGAKNQDRGSKGSKGSANNKQ